VGHLRAGGAIACEGVHFQVVGLPQSLPRSGGLPSREKFVTRAGGCQPNFNNPDRILMAVHRRFVRWTLAWDGDDGAEQGAN